MNKKILSIYLFSALLFGASFASQFQFDPLYSDSRFPPSDKLHAGCDHIVDVSLTDYSQLEDLWLTLSYDVEDIKVTRIVPKQKDWFEIDYNIESGEINFKSKKLGASEYKDEALFQIYFTSKPSLDITEFVIKKDSFLKYKQSEKQFLGESNFELWFESVPECEPDIIAPSIELKYPNLDNKISLDSHFELLIEDVGKWIDKGSLMIHLNGKQLSGTSLKWEWSNLFIYPSERLDLDKEVILDVIVSDLQEYWWANEAKKEFNFHTATGLVFEWNIKPGQELMINNINIVNGTENECDFLNDIYKRTKWSYQNIIKSVLDKLSCTISSENLDSETQIVVSSQDIEKNRKTVKYVSVFGALWWILFTIALILKLHYFYHYHRHKKIIKKLNE